tara:strand:- start:714 stop:1223 length:510 start_codon:yes stop_codon:yes gene_type:complete
MRFKMDRLCELAGVPGSRRRSSILREGTVVGNPGSDEKEKSDEGTYHESYQDDRVDELYEDEEDEKAKSEGQYHDMDEVIEIDEVDLVNELRRARKIMQEAKKKSFKMKKRKQEKLQEMQLKAVIDQEVKNVLRDLNLNSGWVYGNKKPTRSRNGYSHHGSLLSGIGFK